jgi:NAD-dependent SIR2 family protein deacetylase
MGTKHSKEVTKQVDELFKRIDSLERQISLIKFQIEVVRCVCCGIVIEGESYLDCDNDTVCYRCYKR